MDVYGDEELNTLMTFLDARRFTTFSTAAAAGPRPDEGLLGKHLENEIKLETCKLLHSLCDFVLRYRIEAIVNFSYEFVQDLQGDQKKRYNELKERILPSAIMARKTKEFRCPARDQMQALVHFKMGDHDSQFIDLPEHIKEKLEAFHAQLSSSLQIKDHGGSGGDEDADAAANSKSGANGAGMSVFGLVRNIVQVLFIGDAEALASASSSSNSSSSIEPLHNAIEAADASSSSVEADTFVALAEPTSSKHMSWFLFLSAFQIFASLSFFMMCFCVCCC